MMYFQTPEATLYSEMARRLVEVLKLYRSIHSEPKYEVSLNLAILQNLLTHFAEHHKKLKLSNQSKYNLHFLKLDGLSVSEQSSDIWQFYKNLRDCLSHPKAPKPFNISNPPIGYMIHGTNEIESIEFFASAEQRYGRLKDFYISLPTEQLYQITLALGNFLSLTDE